MNEKDRSNRQRDELESLRRRVRELEAALGKTSGDDETLATDDQWLRIIMENSPEGIDICKYNLKTGNRKLIACNDRYVEMAGRSREELMSAEHLDPWVRDISSLGEYDPDHNEFPWRGIASWVRPDGRENYYEWTASHAVVGDEVYIIGVSRDITAGERREEVLARGEYWLKGILDNSFDGINICKYDRRTHKRFLIMCNDRYVEMSGRSREELLAANHVGPLVEDHSYSGSRDPKFGGRPRRGISSWIRPDGKENYYEWTAAYLAFGDEFYVIGVDRDITERKRTEEALARSEYWLRMITEHSSDGINVCKVHPDRGVRTLVMCNDRYVEMSGRSRDELMAAPDINRFEEEIQPLEMGDDDIRKGVSSWIRPDGKENYYEWTASPVNVKGETYVIGVDRDITEHRRMDEALEESEHLYRTTIDAMSDPIHVVDADLRLTLFNAALVQWCGELGLETEAVGKNLFEAFPFLSDKVRGEYRRVFETGEPLATEEVTSMGGRQFTLDVRKVPILENGKVVRVITVVHDITKRRRTNDAMRRSEAKYRTLAENLPQRVFVKDRDLVYVSCNQSYARALKINPEDLPGKTDYDFCPRELAEKYRTDDKRIMQSGQAEDIEERFVEDGRERIVHTVKTPIKDDKGDIVGILGIFWDVTEQKQAEEALRQSEETARALLDGTPDIAFLMTPGGVIVALNEMMARHIGKPMNECIGLDFEDMISPDLLEQRLARSDKVVRSGKPLRFEHEEPDGRFLDHTIYPVFDAEGKVSMLAVFARDITERKRAEEALRESERRLRMVIQNMPIMMDAFDSEWNIVVWNTECERVTGYSADEIVGNPKAMELLYPDADYLRRMEREWEERGNDYRGWEWEITCKDGTKRMVAWFNVSERFPIPDWPTWGFGVDVTERNRAEVAVREAKERLQYVFDNTWDIIFEVDPEGKYTFCNQAAERITGYTQEEILRMNMRELVSPEWIEPTFERMRRRIAGEALEQPFNLDILHKDGQTVSLELATSAAYRDEKLAAILGIARDITERKQAEEAVQAAQHKLVTAREFERRRLARELHDTAGQRAVALHYAIQNILSRAGERLDAELAGQLEKVSRGCSEVIRELRQISHGLYPPTLESLGLTATLRQLAGDAHGGIEVTVSCSEALESARFGEEVEIALFRIAQEALNNALRHSKASLVELLLARKAGRLHLTVTDNGIGFSPDKMSGRGLGLTSMRERAQAVGGELGISSRKGSTRVRATVLTDGSR